MIGQIEKASGFPQSRLFCRWSLHFGEGPCSFGQLMKAKLMMMTMVMAGGGWRQLGGHKEGQTQTDDPVLGDAAYFAHPLDLHLAARSLQGPASSPLPFPLLSAHSERLKAGPGSISKSGPRTTLGGGKFAATPSFTSPRSLDTTTSTLFLPFSRLP